MLTLLKQEIFKAHKQNRLWIWLLLAFIFPIAVLAVFKGTRNVERLVGFGGGIPYIYLAAIIYSALSISQEFTFGTIRPLLSRRFNRLSIFISKIVLNFIVYIGLVVSAFIGTIIAKLIFVPKADFGKQMTDTLTAGQLWGIDTIHLFLEIIFISALVIMITNIVKSSGAAIGLGVVLSIGTPIISSISLSLIQLAPILKWNPLTILIGSSMLGITPDTTLNAIFHLNSMSIIIAYIVYIVLFYGIAYYIFRKRSV